MAEFAAQAVAAACGGCWTRLPAKPLSGFHFDTRQLTSGALFVALAGGARDGHQFVAAAAAAGAGGALVTQPDPALALPQLVVDDTLRALQAIAGWWRSQFKGTVVAITGSCGKTTTKDLLHRLLGVDHCLATAGNYNNHIGVPLTLLSLDPARHHYAVIEAGMNQPGEIAALSALIQPHHALITHVGPAHLEGVGGLDGVAREKAALGQAVAAQGSVRFPVGLLAYDPFRSMLARVVVSQPLADATQGVCSGGELLRWSVEADPIGAPSNHYQQLVIHGEKGTARFPLPRVSTGLASNAVLAISSARDLGVDAALIGERLASWQPTALRGEIRQRHGYRVLVDCYNANPSSMRDALQFFGREFSSPRLYVLGGMKELGTDSAAWHREVGRCIAVQPGDAVWLIGDEAPPIADGLAEVAPQFDRVRLFGDTAAARAAFSGYRGNVLLKGSRAYRLETLVAEDYIHD
jgi:UDP-N-acetylmuramoyl-tripeptide--D-alanyl-D-alanine ligase